MKKIMRILPAFIIGCLLVTGCFSNPTKDLKKASKKMAKLDSYQMILDFTMGVKSQGVEMEVPISMETSYNSKSKAAKMNLSITFFGMKVTTEGYVDYADEKKVVSYTKDTTTGTWSKEESETFADATVAANFIDAAEKIQKVKSDDKNVTHYQITITKEKMLDLMKSSTELLGSSSDMEITETDYEFTKDVVIDVYVNKKSKYITKMVFDLTDSIKMKASDAEDANITKFTMEFAFDKFNEVEEITIPENVAKNAIDKKIAEAKEAIEEYLQTIEFEYMFEDEIPSKVTDTTLGQGGVLGKTPEKVDVTLNSDGEVVDGIIIVNGVTGTIKNGEVTSVK